VERGEVISSGRHIYHMQFPQPSDIMGPERRFAMARPTLKNPDIDNLLSSLTGRSRVDSIRSDVCVFSEDGPVHNMVFTDDLSAREFTISGMCQTCQDRLFG